MCLVIVLHQLVAGVPLIVAANRDELHARPSSGMQVLEEGPPRLCGGRDERAGGTWMATSALGVVAALTNVPRAEPDPTLASRGALPLVAARQPDAHAAAQAVAEHTAKHPTRRGWMLIGDREALYYLDATEPGTAAVIERLSAGITVLENRPLGVPSPKADRVRELLGSGDPGPQVVEKLKTVLADRKPLDARGPVSSLLVDAGPYGTRSSTITRIDDDGLPQLWFCDGPPDRGRFETRTALFTASTRG